MPAERFARANLKKHNPKTVRKNTGDTYEGCPIIRVSKGGPECRVMAALWSAIAQQASSKALP